MGTKWSDSSPDGKLLSRMLKFAKKLEVKIEKAMDKMETSQIIDSEEFDKLFDKYLRLMHRVSIAGKAKKDIARSTDWEQRLKELEEAKALTPDELALLKRNEPDTVKAKST